MDWSGAHLITPNPLGQLEDSGPDLREGIGKGVGGSWQLTSLGARLWVTGLKEGSRPHAGKVRSRKPIFSTALPLNIPRLSWNTF